MLFLTNLVAIVVIGTGAFVAAGFKHVDVLALEREELQKGHDAPIARALAKRLASLFESRAGPVLRLFMPLALLAAVYVPLGRALDEVAWEVRVRAAVRASLGRVKHRVVETRARVEHHEVDVVLVLLGKAADAVEVRRRMDAEIRKVAGVVPRIEVVAVPDASAFAGLETSLLTARPATLTPAGPSSDQQLNAVRARIRATLEPLWPTAVAGRPLVIEARFPMQQAATLNRTSSVAGREEATDRIAPQNPRGPATTGESHPGLGGEAIWCLYSFEARGTVHTIPPLTKLLELATFVRLG